MVSVKQDTFNRVHKHCQRGEKHDNFVNRLIDVCLSEEQEVNLTDGTLEKLLKFANCTDVDEALNFLMDKFRKAKA